ncbi:MAG: YfhO family protein [Bacilli bacterium]|nr:YfhO family protein [Bacilli bacterium]
MVKKISKYIIPFIISFVILTLIYILNGFYPFGGHSIVQVDADYQFIPVLYRIYDFLHGNANVIYDDIGLGNNIYISMIIQGSLFSPINLLLYLTSRENILNYFNIIVMIKICFISLTTYIYINNKYKVNDFYKVLFSILFALSGYTFLNYFNIMWLDSIILFPLIVMYLDKLLFEEKYIGYIITLSMSLAISYYISYFILIFIIFYSFINIYLVVKNDKARRVTFKLGLATFISFCISSFSLLPALYQTLVSSRFDSSSVASIFDTFMNKSLYLMGSSLFIILFMRVVSKYKKDNVKIFCLILLLSSFLIGMFVEPINLAFHMGSHWSFPYRYSFITIFILMMGSLFYISKFGIKGSNPSGYVIIYVLILVIGFYFNIYYLDKIVDSQIVLDFDDFDVYKIILILFTISMFLYAYSISFKNKYLMYITLAVSSFFIIFTYSTWTMYYNSGYFLVKDSLRINNNFDLPNDGRYKMNYTVYTPSYGFIYDVPTLDNWLHVLPSSEVKLYRALGYETSDTCIRSYGGTVFSDWLLNFKYIISTNRLDDPIYEFISNYNEYYLYKYNYNGGFGVVYNEFEDMVYDEYSPFGLQNKIYDNLFSGEIISVTDYYFDSSLKYEFEYDVKEKGFLYFYSNSYPDYIDYVKVNDEYIYDFDNYIKYLGIYESVDKITVGLKTNFNIDFSIGFIKYEDVLKLSNSNVLEDNSMIINSNGGNLFLPINNIDGLEIFNNGVEVQTDKYLNNFVSIKLNDGENKISIDYEMPLFKIGLILSVIGIILFILFNKITGNNVIYSASYYIFIILVLGLYFYYYAYSILKYMR